MLNNLNIKIRYIFIFIILYLFVVLLNTINKNNLIDYEVNSATKMLKTNYNTVIVDKKMEMGNLFAFYNAKNIDKVNQNYMIVNIIFAVLILVILYLLYKKEILQKEHEKQIVENAKFETLGYISAGITHEINTPLSYIKGLVEMSRYDLEDMPDNSLKPQLLKDNEKIMDGIKRMAVIIESIREISQTSIGDTTEQNIYSTLIVALEMLHHRAKKISNIYINGERFMLDNLDKNRYRFMANIQKEKIEQAWVIILNNALDELVKIEDFKNRRIDITIKECNNKIKVVFKDNAGGIPKEIIDNIFEPFTSTKEASGIGIGLNVVKKIIEQHNSTITATNCGDGACFTIELPLIKSLP